MHPPSHGPEPAEPTRRICGSDARDVDDGTPVVGSPARRPCRAPALGPRQEAGVSRRPCAGGAVPGRRDAGRCPAAATPAVVGRSPPRRVTGAGAAVEEQVAVGDEEVRLPSVTTVSTTSPGADARGAREVHQPAVAGAPGQPTAVGVLAALPRGDQQLDARADEGTVACPADLVLQGRQAQVPLLHDLLGQLAVHVGGRVPGRLEYWKVKALENCAAATTSRVCWKSGLGLAREAHDDVGGDRGGRAWRPALRVDDPQVGGPAGSRVACAA